MNPIRALCEIDTSVIPVATVSGSKQPSDSLLCRGVTRFYPPSLLRNKIRTSTRLGNGVFIAASAINSLCVTVSVFTLREVLAFKCQLVVLNWIHVLLRSGR